MTSASEALGLWRCSQGVQKPVVFPIQEPLVAIYKSPFALQHQKNSSFIDFGAMFISATS